jgi:hypothetical protein
MVMMIESFDVDFVFFFRRKLDINQSINQSVEPSFLPLVSPFLFFSLPEKVERTSIPMR